MKGIMKKAVFLGSCRYDGAGAFRMFSGQWRKADRAYFPCAV